MTMFMTRLARLSFRLALVPFLAMLPSHAMAIGPTDLIPSAPLVGTVYKIEGILEGRPVVYVGSAHDLKARLSNDHQWAELLRADSTTISAKDVHAELNVAASNRGTLLSARNEALRSAEERALQETERKVAVSNEKLAPGQPKAEVLNKNRPAIDPAEWEARHQVTTSKRWRTIKGPGMGVKLGANGLLLAFDIFLMWRDEKISRYTMAPYVLADGKGPFIFGEERSQLLFWTVSERYFKTYIVAGGVDGRVEISKAEFLRLKQEAEALYGTVDWKGDFIPGLLRPAIPEVGASASGHLRVQ